jgi:phage FluMu protein Com
MVKTMTETAPNQGVRDILCPHCHKEFRAELMVGGSARHTGFKCPHCKLFVAFERTDEAQD